MDSRLKNHYHSRSPADSFKQCAMCHYCWESRELFLQDPQLRIIGYQANFVNLETGLFLFNHSCGTTLAVWAKDFLDLYGGPIYDQRATGSKQCPGFCLVKEELRPCPAHCECAHVREVVAIIESWPKQSSPGP